MNCELCCSAGPPQMHVRITPEFCFTHWTTQVPPPPLVPLIVDLLPGHMPPAHPSCTPACSCPCPCSAVPPLEAPSTPTSCWAASPRVLPPHSATTPLMPRPLW